MSVGHEFLSVEVEHSPPPPPARPVCVPGMTERRRFNSSQNQPTWAPPPFFAHRRKSLITALIADGFFMARLSHSSQVHFSTNGLGTNVGNIKYSIERRSLKTNRAFFIESELERGGGGGRNYPPICRYKFGEITWPRGMKFPGRRSVDGFVGGAIMWLCTKMKRGRSEAE